MNPKRTSSLTAVVTLMEAKSQLRETSSNHDTVITRKINSATLICEKLCNRSFVDSTWEYYLDVLEDVVRIPLMGVSSVTSIEYQDQDDNPQTLDPSDYIVDVNSEPCRIDPGLNWPVTNCHKGNVKITFQAGFADVASVPEDIKEAVLLMVGKLFEIREDSIQKLPTSVEYLLSPYTYDYFV